MDNSIIKEKVMNSIRNALFNKDEMIGTNLRDVDEYYYPNVDDELEVMFAQQFIETGGKFVFCENNIELIRKLNSAVKSYEWKNIYCNHESLKEIVAQAQIETMKTIPEDVNGAVSIMPCELMIARQGSVMFSLFSESEEALFSNADILVILARMDKIVVDLKDAMSYIQEKYINSLPPTVTILTGPSKSNSIENRFVIGGQGPEEIFLFLVNDKL